MRNSFAVLLLVSVFVLLNCKSDNNENLDQAMLESANRYWGDSFSKCEDGYYGRFITIGQENDTAPIIKLPLSIQFITYRLDENERDIIEKKITINGAKYIGRTSLLGLEGAQQFENGTWTEIEFGSPAYKKYFSLTSDTLEPTDALIVGGDRNWIVLHGLTRFLKIDCLSR